MRARLIGSCSWPRRQPPRLELASDLLAVTLGWSVIARLQPASHGARSRQIASEVLVTLKGLIGLRHSCQRMPRLQTIDLNTT